MKLILNLAILLLLVSFQSQAATEINSGVLYPPGSVLKVSAYGIELKVPDNWKAQSPRNSEVLIMQPTGTVARMIVTAIPNSSEQSIRQLMSQHQRLDAMTQLEPSEQVTENDGLFVQSYEITGTNPQKLVASAYGKLGDNRTAVLVIMAEPEKQELLPALGRQFIESVSFLTPKTEAEIQSEANSNINWDRVIRGRTLEYVKTGRGLSTTRRLNLCSNGSFDYSENDSYMSNNAKSNFNFNSQTGQNGRWQVRGNQLQLFWSDGTRSQYSLSKQYVPRWDEWGMFMDDERWFNNRNRVCN